MKPKYSNNLFFANYSCFFIFLSYLYSFHIYSNRNTENYVLGIINIDANHELFIHE